ncbi:hypothetical protein DFH07DRAFT_507806 [Mycena maculata]|uniref:Uncharacterized protein n=1 Tax=Mycena maculata TaxID=230809 RepID=A0AAD7NX37_9AGAR|nr:hypothetical protein DFH07DRAFT_507806 [Mycena maculata]
MRAWRRVYISQEAALRLSSPPARHIPPHLGARLGWPILARGKASDGAEGSSRPWVLARDENREIAGAPWYASPFPHADVSSTGARFGLPRMPCCHRGATIRRGCGMEGSRTRFGRRAGRASAVVRASPSPSPSPSPLTARPNAAPGTLRGCGRGRGRGVVWRTDADGESCGRERARPLLCPLSRRAILTSMRATPSSASFLSSPRLDISSLAEVARRCESRDPRGGGPASCGLGRAPKRRNIVSTDDPSSPRASSASRLPFLFPLLLLPIPPSIAFPPMLAELRTASAGTCAEWASASASRGTSPSLFPSSRLRSIHPRAPSIVRLRTPSPTVLSIRPSPSRRPDCNAQAAMRPDRRTAHRAQGA